jgi:hypothetical protein
MSLAATIRRGSEEDVGAIEYIVRPAYQHYIARIGQPPGPMTNDYHAQVATGNVWVLVFDGGNRCAWWCWCPNQATCCSKT